MTTTTKPAKVNYLSNKDILKEIHKSKTSYCWLLEPKYHQFDIILNSIDDINTKTLLEAKENQAKRIQTEGYANAMLTHNKADYRNKPKQKDFAVELDTIKDSDVVFRVMTYAHIPDAPGRKKNPKTEADTKVRINFHPFKHYAYIDGVLTEVGRSHWKGDLDTGEFCCTHGALTNKLGSMFLLLVERYSHLRNWRGYSYVDEMRGAALVQLTYIALRFNEAESDNPFAYYTASLKNSFTGVYNTEKRNQTLRDDILIDRGHLPSYNRQLDHENELRELRESAESDFNDIDI